MCAARLLLQGTHIWPPSAEILPRNMQAVLNPISYILTNHYSKLLLAHSDGAADQPHSDGAANIISQHAFSYAPHKVAKPFSNSRSKQSKELQHPHSNMVAQRLPTPLHNSAAEALQCVHQQYTH